MDSLVFRRALGLVLATITCLLAVQSSSIAASKVIYETRFEASEGFSGKFTLLGQLGWTGFGSGGNGIVTNYFDGGGQQAFIGGAAPNAKDDSLSLFRPLNFKPDPKRQEVVTFSVLMAILDSSTTNRDDFRWSAYNSKGDRLFSLSFDNNSLDVSYALDDGKGFIATGTQFTNAALYALSIQMNFGRNLWSASANGLSLVNARPISTRFDTALDLADMDAVWLPTDPRFPGDNYLLFDDYRVVVDNLDLLPPLIEAVSRIQDGRMLLRVFGEPGIGYRIQASQDLKQWSTIQTSVAPLNGILDYLDLDAPVFGRRFYRAEAFQP